jgi:hypothetical protein
VAVPDRQTAIDLMNQARYFLPHLLALSTSSPFWMGRDTGLKSYRTTIFRRFPRTGVPDRFDSWSEYEQYVQLLVDLHCMEDARKIWWDIRPHPTYGTLEFRVCDVPTRPAEAVMLGQPMAMLMKHLTEAPRPLRERNDGITTTVGDLIDSLLAKQPDSRPANAGDVARALRAARNSGETMAAPAPPSDANRLVTEGFRSIHYGMSSGPAVRTHLEEAGVYFKRALALEPRT